MALIGVDIGTTGCKAHVFTDELVLVTSASREYSVDIPYPDWVEQNPEAVWSLAKQCLTEAIHQAGVADCVKAISLSVQGEAVVPVNNKGNPLRPMILGMDTRTREENKWLLENFDARDLFDTTGMPIHTINTLPKLLWIKKNEPQVWKAAHKFLLYEDFIIHKLTGEAVISQCLASRTQLYDLKQKQWSHAILEKIGLEKEKLAVIKPSGVLAGTMSNQVAAELGLRTCPNVATGGHDQACGALGAGIIRAGMAMVSNHPVIDAIHKRPMA